jgi:hypothetical protein
LTVEVSESSAEVTIKIAILRRVPWNSWSGSSQ